MEQRRGVGGTQRAEQRDGGGRAPVPGRLDGHEMDGQGVARFGALDVERAGLRVEVGKLADLRDQVGLAAHPAGETVLGEHLQHGRGPDPGERRRPAERPRVLTGCRPEGADLQVAHVTPAGIDAAMAAPGAISVTLWKRTSRSPIASRRSPGAAVAVVFAAMAASDVVMPLLPGWSHGGWRPWQAQTCSACGTIAACVVTGLNPAELARIRS